MSLSSCSALLCLEALNKITKNLKVRITSAEIRKEYVLSTNLVSYLLTNPRLLLYYFIVLILLTYVI
jgi:hypothetical protein